MSNPDKIYRRSLLFFWPSTILFYGGSMITVAGGDYSGAPISSLTCVIISCISAGVLLFVAKTKWKWALIPHGVFMILWVFDDLDRLGFID